MRDPVQDTARSAFGRKLNPRDRAFLSLLGRSIRESTTEFELGGKLIDARFSLRPTPQNGGLFAPQAWSGPLQSPQQRLKEALRWALEPATGTNPDELQAICILTWLASDESAHLVERVLCDLQLIPWKPVLAGIDADPRGALALWGSREVVALEAFDRRLVEAARRSSSMLER